VVMGCFLLLLSSWLRCPSTMLYIPHHAVAWQLKDAYACMLARWLLSKVCGSDSLTCCTILPLPCPVGWLIRPTYCCGWLVNHFYGLGSGTL